MGKEKGSHLVPAENARRGGLHGMLVEGTRIRPPGEFKACCDPLVLVHDLKFPALGSVGLLERANLPERDSRRCQLCAMRAFAKAG